VIPEGRLLAVSYKHQPNAVMLMWLCGSNSAAMILNKNFKTGIKSKSFFVVQMPNV